MTYGTSPATSLVRPGAEARFQTRTAVLDAAERLFAERGVDGVSIREITAAAGANLGAINYHFGSKERLVIEVFARRLAPVNRERLTQLDALERAAGERAPGLAAIVEAIVRPSVESEPGGEAILRLISRSFVEPNPGLKQFVDEQFAEVARRFDAAILRAVPGLSPEELFWRMTFLLGALHHAQEVWVRFDPVSNPGESRAAARPDREGFIQRVVAFVTAGMRSEVPRAGKRSTRSSNLKV